MEKREEKAMTKVAKAVPQVELNVSNAAANQNPVPLYLLTIRVLTLVLHVAHPSRQHYWFYILCNFRLVFIAI